MASEISREQSKMDGNKKLSSGRSVDSENGHHHYENDGRRETSQTKSSLSTDEMEMDDEKKESEVELIPAPPPKVNAWFAAKNSPSSKNVGDQKSGSSDQKMEAKGKIPSRKDGKKFTTSYQNNF